ncbi:hypothetical protein [Gordonia aurantiaca]|uniref:hypothetical protein n=1 Tax=Gordonia sp. B21 TaxID=3151852 RepID=UPI003267955F
MSTSPPAKSCVRSRSGLLAGLVAALALTIGGCSSDEAEPGPSTSVTPSSASSAATTSSRTPSASSSASSSATTSATSAAAAPTAPDTDGASTPSTKAPSTKAPSGARAANPSCREFRELEDDARAAAVAALGVKSNSEQVAMVAAAACLGRERDKVADVLDELVPGR